jgi:methionyl-tRNA formyltransferase
MNRLKIVFFGEDGFSAIVLKSLIDKVNVALVVTPYYENFIYKRLELICAKNKIKFLRVAKINSEETYTRVSEVHPDLCVITHLDWLIKKPLLTIPPMGFINLHPALLPDYRGMSPQHWPIINGENETGVTVHYIDEKADTGDIIIQERIPLSDNDYVSDLQRKWQDIYKHIVVDAIERILDSSFEPQKQFHLSGRYYGRLKESDCMLKLDMSEKQAYNLIKGVSMPYSGAKIDDVIIWRAHIPTDEEKKQYDTLNLDYGCNLETPFGDIFKLQQGYIKIDKYKKL